MTEAERIKIIAEILQDYGQLSRDNKLIFLGAIKGMQVEKMVRLMVNLDDLIKSVKGA